MRRIPWVLLTILAVVAGVAIGVTAYNAGVNHGLDQAHSATEVIRTVGPGFGFFPFGFFLFPLLFFAIFAIAGRRRRWHWNGHDHHGPAHVAERFDDWHRHQHEQPADRTSS